MTTDDADDTRDTQPNTPEKSAAKVLGREMKKALPRRFYKEVGLGVTLEGFAILLDGRPVKTPTKSGLTLPTEGLANAVAREWADQVKEIDPATMPLTKLCNTAIDRVRGRETEIVDELAAYADSDLVCYRAAHPLALAQAQAAAWDPVLAWARASLGAPFVTVQGLSHQPQPETSIEKARSALAEFDAFELCALHNITTLTGSVLLALAHARDGRAGAQSWALEKVWSVAHVDEDFQIAAWGQDDDAVIRRAGRWREMQAAGQLLRLARKSVRP